MSVQSNGAVDPVISAPPPAAHDTHPLYWSVRREIWENRSIYIAPLIVTAVVLFASLVGSFGLAKRVRNAPNLEPAKRHAAIIKPYSIAPAPIMFTTFLVGMFYSLDALYGDRRDRSILFWKSLPVSDATTVLSKALVPFAVLPAIGFVLGTFAQLFIVVCSTFVLVIHGVNPTLLWAELGLMEPIVAIYGLAVFSLWFAPIYGWLMLVSAWARRAPVLWAVFPLLLISAVERIVLGTSWFIQFLGYRVTGAMKLAFSPEVKRGAIIDHAWQLDPLRFLSSPGLWGGLILAAAFFALAVHRRRYHEPL